MSLLTRTPPVDPRRRARTRHRPAACRHRGSAPRRRPRLRGADRDPGRRAVPGAARDSHLHVVHGLAAARLAPRSTAWTTTAQLGSDDQFLGAIKFTLALHGDHHGRAVRRSRSRSWRSPAASRRGTTVLPDRVLLAVRRRHGGRVVDVVGQLQRPARRLQQGAARDRPHEPAGGPPRHTRSSARSP